MARPSANASREHEMLLGNPFVCPQLQEMTLLMLDADSRAELDKRRRGESWTVVSSMLDELLRASDGNSSRGDPKVFFQAMTSLIDDLDQVIRHELRHLRELETESFLAAGTRIDRVRTLVWLVLAYLGIMGVFLYRRWCIALESARRLEELRAQKELILSAAGEGIFGLNADGTFSFVNPSALTMLGYSADEIIGSYSHTLIHHHYPDGREYPAEECPIYRAWRCGKVERRDSDVFWKKDGTALEVEYISTPISDSSGIQGAVVVFSDITVRRRLERDLREALQELETAQEQESRIGFQIQEALLFGNPPQGMPDLHIARLAIPAQGVDGDFFNFVSLDDETLDILVGDVMGKGIAAALVGAATKSQFQLALAESGGPGVSPTPQTVVTRVCRHMSQPLSQVNRFVCLHYGRIHRKERRLVLVNCGHTPLVHFCAETSRCQQFFPENPPLGTEEGRPFPETTVPYAQGDLFVFFSDGITEARDADRVMFGTERLLTLIERHAPHGADAVAEAIRAAVQTHTGAVPVQDDVTCIVIEARRFSGA